MLPRRRIVRPNASGLNTGRSPGRSAWLRARSLHPADHSSSLLSRISNLNCQPSKVINIRPNSSQVMSRPSTTRSGTRPSSASSHPIPPRTIGRSASCNPRLQAASADRLPARRSPEIDSRPDVPREPRTHLLPHPVRTGASENERRGLDHRNQ